ncbi:MAG: hypothetical protein AAFS10_12895 [Myxococcota bacterium]
MEENVGLIGRIEQTWAGFTQREQRLVTAMLIILPLLAVFLIGTRSWNALSDLGTAVEENKAALELIERKRGAYLASKGSGGGAKSLKERIETNELKLTTFLDKEASKFSLKIDNFKESSAPVGSKGSKKDVAAGGVIEESVNVNIRDAEYSKFARFLDAIHRSRELLVIKHVEVNRRRRAQDQSKVDVQLTISTFKTKREG